MSKLERTSDGDYLVMPDDIAILVKTLEWYASKVLLESDDHIRAKVALALIRQNTITTTCESCGLKLIVALATRPENEAPATFCAACGGGCDAWSAKEILP